MITILFVGVIVAAVVAMGLKRRAKAQARRASFEGPGSSPEEAIAIRTFADMDDELWRRHCLCGARFSLAGEGTRDAGGRVFRVARLYCDECDETREVFFDTSSLLQ
jgi:hypothetical protein